MTEYKTKFQRKLDELLAESDLSPEERAERLREAEEKQRNMNKTMRTLGILFGLAGLYLLGDALGWKVPAGIFLIWWGKNLME